MSKYKVIATEYRNRDCLVQALGDLGLPVEQAEGNTLHLFGYRGDQRQQAAAVVVRRQQIDPLANDLGFAWNGQRFEAIVSEYDSTSHAHGAQILQSLKQKYAVREVTRQARLKGYGVQAVQAEGGVVRLRLVQY